MTTWPKRKKYQKEAWCDRNFLAWCDRVNAKRILNGSRKLSVADLQRRMTAAPSIKQLERELIGTDTRRLLKDKKRLFT